MDAMTYNRMFTLHGVVMIFLFMIPAIPSGFGNFLVPIMVGAKDVAFPRLNLLSFYIYLLGAVIALCGHDPRRRRHRLDLLHALLAPPPPPRWCPSCWAPSSSASPRSSPASTSSSPSTPCGRRGITWNKLPLFVWSIYATSIIQILATPVLGMTLLLVAIENAFGWGIFDPARGGDPVLFQHFFWFYSHPAVYIMILPAMAVISEVVCAFSRKNIFGYKAVAYSSLGIAFVGFFTWGHHLFTSRAVGLRRRRLRRALDVRGHLHRHQGLQLGGHHVQGVDQLQDALHLLRRLPLLPRLRRHDRRGAGDGLARRPLARHLLRGGPLPLHHGRRDASWPSWPRSTTGCPRSPAACTTSAGAWWAPRWSSSASSSPSCRSSCSATRACRAATSTTRSGSRRSTWPPPPGASVLAIGFLIILVYILVALRTARWPAPTRGARAATSG